MADVAARSVADLVRRSAERFGAAEAVVDGDVRLTFAELADRVERAAHGFARLGVRLGDRVAIWAPNSWAWVVTALGASAAGGVLVPINTRFKGREARYVIERSGAGVLVTVRDFLGTDYVASLDDAGRPDELRHVVDLDRDLDELLGGPASGPLPDPSPDHLSDIIFTSGTTGAPKGVMTTHAQTLRVFEVWSDVVGLSEGDRYLVVNPFFHTFGYKAGFVSAIMRGSVTIPHAVFDVPSVAEKIREERVTMLPGPPTLYQSLLNAPDRGDLSTLRLAVTGAAVVPVELVRRMSDELGFETVLTAYGLTEATGVVTMCRRDDDAETIANTCGRAIPDTEVRVVDDAGAEVPRGTPGEVVVRGYNVMRGYHEDSERTAEAVRDGWLHTGDVGVMDERGYLRITDRKKDMFIVGGFNAYPAEIENELVLHPTVAQAAVVGVPDERLGEVGHAFVVPRAGTDVDAGALVAWCRDRMANYKVPRVVEVVDALPTNASGKVLKHELRDRVTRG